MALIISVLHNFVNIFIYILYSFAYFSQPAILIIVYLLYKNDTFSTNIVSFVYCRSPDFVHPCHIRFLPAEHPPRLTEFLPRFLYAMAGLLRRKRGSSCGSCLRQLSLPWQSPRSVFHVAGRSLLWHENSGTPSGAPAVCRIHILFTYRSGPGILRTRSPLALDHDTDDLFIGLFHSVLGETAHVLDGVLHTLLYDAVAAIELLAFDVHIIA